MRTIKFRAIKKEGLPYNQHEYFTLEDLMRGKIVFTYPEHWHLSEGTGLHDKNGKEIYEGDILRWTYDEDNGYRSSKGGKIFSIYYNPGTAEYKTSDGDSMWSFLTHPIEVIGNIYENEELLN